MPKWKAVPAVAVAIACGAGILTHGSTKVMTLTPLDSFEIQQLVTRYAYAVDSGADNGYLYARLFAPDGVFVQRNGQTVMGRNGLAELARRNQKGPMSVFHFIMNHVIEPTADGAIGREYLVQINIGENGQPSTLSGGGRYEDVYVKTAEGWRFKRRQFLPSQSGPQPAYQGPTLSVPLKFSGATTKGSTLTPADYLEIQQLVARYPYGLDTGADTGYMYANVFAPDGVFVTPNQRIEGREALKAFAWQHRPGQGPLYSRNFSTNVQIKPSPEGATGRVFALVLDIGEGGKSSTIIGGGHYEDVYVRTSNGWRIKSRQFLDNQIGALPPEKVQPERSRHTAPAPLVRPTDPNAIRLTAQDYVDIQQLAARYSHALDAGFDNGYAYADLFTRDGAAFDRWIGREPISEIPRTGARQPYGPNYVRHYATNHLIEPTATGVIGKQYVVVIDLPRDGKPASIFLGGQYQDVYVKTPQGWRFKTRTEFRSGYTPQTPPQIKTAH